MTHFLATVYDIFHSKCQRYALNYVDIATYYIFNGDLVLISTAESHVTR